MNEETTASVADIPRESVPQSPGSVRRIRPFALAALVLLGIVAGGWSLVADTSEELAPGFSDQKTPALTVTTATPRRAVWPVTLTASGSIAPWQEASVGAQVGGYQLVEVRVNVGDQVRRGEVLARLDSALLRAEEAQLLATNEQAIADRQRALALQSEGAISDQEVLQFVTAAKVSAALLASKRLQLRYTDVTAPDDGVISARTATLGAVSAAGEELFRLIRGGRLEWRGELTAAQLSSVAKGQLVELALPDGSSASAKVRDTAPSLDGRSRLGLVYADLVSGSHARAGMYANGQVVVSQASALVVPAETVVIRDGRTYVVKLSEETATPTVALQSVTLGRRRNDEVEIVSGLTGIETLIKAGAGFLSDGDIVRVAHMSALQSSAVRGRETAL
jgi:RND family efflux transporter MFP subunit